MRYSATRILATIFVIMLPVVGAAQCGSLERDSPEVIRAEVNRLFNKALDAMEGTLPSGDKVITWMPPDDSTRDQIKCLGTGAVPATAELLRSTGRSFGHTLAIRMLAWEGGPEIVPPLAEFLAKSGDSLLGLKLEALEALTAAPSEKALPVVGRLLRSEKNPDLLKAAARVKATLMGSGS